MRALVIHCHPDPSSFTAAVRDTVLSQLHDANVGLRLTDLYADGYDPALGRDDLARYGDPDCNRSSVRKDVDDLSWCDTLIFVYPTWWYGLPAMLKGWLDRSLLPGHAFVMPDGQNRTIRPGLTHITQLGVFTTCGASRWLTLFVGAPGKRTLLRGVRLLCARRCRTAFAAHYLMDSSTPKSRAAHLDRVSASVRGLIAAAGVGA